VRVPLLSPIVEIATLDETLLDLAGADPAPANRAARRGRAGKPAPSGAVHADAAGRARAAQGRRINPVRRTG
jgi:hypothetical protein